MADIRFIIIATFESQLSEKIQKIRLSINEKYNCQWALSFPVHITLRTGAIVPEQKISAYVAGFSYMAESMQKTDVRILPTELGKSKYEGETNFFVYSPVEKSKSLMTLHNGLLDYDEFIKRKQTSYNPHVTLLWDNVSKHAEQEIFDQLRHYDISSNPLEAVIDNVSLYCLADNVWKFYKKFTLN